MNSRKIRQDEQALVKQLLSLSGRKLETPEIVVQLDDGGMGSIRFPTAKTSERRYGRDVIQVSYKDTDDVLVIIALIEDNNGDLYELEFWKTDFKPLNRYPTPSDIVVDTKKEW